MDVLSPLALAFLTLIALFIACWPIGLVLALFRRTVIVPIINEFRLAFIKTVDTNN